MEKKKRILISEEAHNEAIESILAENFVPGREKVLRIVELLKEYNIIPVKTCDISSNGLPTKVKSMAITDGQGQILKELTLAELVSTLDSLTDVQRMFKDDKDRRKFIETVIRYWYDGKITKDGLMPVNYIK